MKTKKMPGKAEQSFESKSGRGDTIRTCDPLLPKQVLYQAELRPDVMACLLRSTYD